ncbi:nucleotide pyrophosphohydrolase [Mucilaginibacter pineti]|nr:nucleotide pyrophosphohydrolase [Mucilaginibacter pineti]
MSEIAELTKKLIQFRDERDWQQFHNSKDLALAVSIEAGELLELFLWKGNEDVSKEKLKDELADVLSYCLLLAEKHQLSITDIIQDKINKNADKYPAHKAKGNAKKYTEL